MSFLISIACCIVLVIVFKKFNILKRKYLEPTFMVIMLLGIIALCQPLSFFLYRYGFTILLTGLVGFNISIHMKQTT
jgi:hypothetical protein